MTSILKYPDPVLNVDVGQLLFDSPQHYLIAHLYSNDLNHLSEVSPRLNAISVNISNHSSLNPRDVSWSARFRPSRGDSIHESRGSFPTPSKLGESSKATTIPPQLHPRTSISLQTIQNGRRKTLFNPQTPHSWFFRTFFHVSSAVRYRPQYMLIPT